MPGRSMQPSPVPAPNSTRQTLPELPGTAVQRRSGRTPDTPAAASLCSRDMRAATPRGARLSTRHRAPPHSRLHGEHEPFPTTAPAPPAAPPSPVPTAACRTRGDGAAERAVGPRWPAVPAAGSSGTRTRTGGCFPVPSPGAASPSCCRRRRSPCSRRSPRTSGPGRGAPVAGTSRPYSPAPPRSRRGDTRAAARTMDRARRAAPRPPRAGHAPAGHALAGHAHSAAPSPLRAGGSRSGRAAARMRGLRGWGRGGTGTAVGGGARARVPRLRALWGRGRAGTAASRELRDRGNGTGVTGTQHCGPCRGSQRCRRAAGCQKWRGCCGHRALWWAVRGQSTGSCCEVPGVGRVLPELWCPVCPCSSQFSTKHGSPQSPPVWGASSGLGAAVGVPATMAPEAPSALGDAKGMPLPRGCHRAPGSREQ